ncbi:MAG: phosphatidic acid phosphatase, partial [Robiginitalea sp.]|nr:phosphatidic acid phosphatase [Robiginitalea sp.]
MKAIVISFLALGLLLGSCRGPSEPIEITAEQLHASNDKLTEVMVHDIFSPPVASRVYAYPNIAAYEIMALHNEAYR